jgi:hypothetical protein
VQCVPLAMVELWSYLKKKLHRIRVLRRVVTTHTHTRAHARTRTL